MREHFKRRASLHLADIGDRGRLVLVVLLLSALTMVSAQTDNMMLGKIDPQIDSVLINLKGFTLNPGGDGYIIPDRFKITSVSVKEKQQQAKKYYLLTISDQWITLMDNGFISENMPVEIPLSSMIQIPLDNLDYVKTLTQFTFSSIPLGENNFYRRFISKKFWNAFLLTAGVTAGLGLIIDILFAGSGLVTFPVVTAVFSITGLPFGFLAAGMNYLWDSSGKTGLFYAKHLANMEDIKFKYYFKQGSRRFNLKALKFVSIKSLDKTHSLK